MLLHCIGVVRLVDTFSTMSPDRIQCTAQSWRHRDPFSCTMLPIPKVSHTLLSLNRRLHPIAKGFFQDKTIKQSPRADFLGMIIARTSSAGISPKRIQLAFDTNDFVRFSHIKLPDITRPYPTDPTPTEALQS